MTKYIFVTGGVVSGLGKGIVAASLGSLLKQRGYKITSQKFDPYLNVDPGTMNPIEHGEVFVTEDGLETDLDLGHYERFIDENLTRYSNLTSGKIFSSVIEKERKGEYLGKTVQIIPNITDEIKNFIRKTQLHTQSDIIITEIGGTIGDIESQSFLEAVRQFSCDVGRDNCLFIHVCLVPFISGSNEYKSKPTQHSVRELQSLGIAPDIIVTRSDEELDEGILNKIAMFCNVDKTSVINNVTLKELYECPLYLHKKGLDKEALKHLKLPLNKIDLTDWKKVLKNIKNRKGIVKIAIVGKYIKLHDAYISVVESLKHASFANSVNVAIKWVDSEQILSDNIAEELLSDCQAILVPGGFGIRGTEGMILACKYARLNNIPYLGICLGMQIAVIEFARDVANIKNANSCEFDGDGEANVIDIMENQKGAAKGGTMRLGAYPCIIKEGTFMATAYGEKEISERHRHRYEFNNKYKDILISKGLIISGESPDKSIVETVELKRDVFFVGVQFHPEFKSRPNRAHPLFRDFVKAAKEKL